VEPPVPAIHPTSKLVGILAKGIKKWGGLGNRPISFHDNPKYTIYNPAASRN
jgi:hypothetical protein